MIYISFDIGIKNLALCILENKDNNITIIDWRVITLADKKKDVNGLNLISEILFYELDNIIGCIEELNYDTIDYVIIENQPSNLNGIMKSIQLLIFSYFSLLTSWPQAALISLPLLLLKFTITFFSFRKFMNFSVLLFEAF